MKFSENWLRQLVEIPASREALVERLTMAGLEVDAVRVLGEGLDDVVVGEIIGIEPHPDADRLRICSVAADEAEPLTIVCGAPNACKGLKAPLAKVGAVLPGGIKIKPAKLRGVKSFGMLCSARELGLTDEASGLMELAADAVTGKPVAEALGLPDAEIEVGLTPNRSDCLGMVGLARDVAAQYGFSHALPEQATMQPQTASQRGIRLDAGADCPRYLGRSIEGMDMQATTPAWMADRLTRAGMRPISLVVDVTNYVQLELGQPMHAFDQDKLDGDIIVRHAVEAEALTLLDGNDVTLDPSFLVIADQQKLLAVAGVMGGLDSAVDDSTRAVFLESAHFAPSAIMGRARRLGMHTDASHRFERGVDPDMPRRALERATELLISLAGGRAGPVCAAEHVDQLPERKPVTLRRQRLARVLGIDIEDQAVQAILDHLGLSPTPVDGGWRVQAPSWRFDIEREEDLIEEVARIHGYAEIPVRAPSGELVLSPESETRVPTRQLAGQLMARGYHEAVCMAFTRAELLETWQMAQHAVALANPLSADQAIMRPSLLPGLVDALQRNRARQQARVRLFESGHVFGAAAGEDQAPSEHATLALVACGHAHVEQWGVASRPVDFHDIKGDVQSLLAMGGQLERWRFDGADVPGWLHPGRAAWVLCNDQRIGLMGELHPKLLATLGIDAAVQVAELDLEAIREHELPKAKAVTRQPQVRRDLAVELDRDVSWQQVADCVRAAAGPRLVDLLLFDRYQGEKLQAGRKSLAMGLILQERSRTLTDDEVDTCIGAVVAALSDQCAAKLRG